MPTTGADLNRELDLQIDKDYTGYYDPVKKNRLFRRAFNKLIEDKYRSLDTQQEYDELTQFLKVSKPYTVRNGKVYTAPFQISGVSAVGTTVTFTTALPHVFQVGDTVDISGLQGLNITGGSFLVSAVTSTTFSVTATVTGTYVSGSGIVSSGFVISDYRHFLTAKLFFSVRAGVVSGASNSSPIVITTASRNNLRTGERINVNSVTGNTAANGDWFIKRLGEKTFALYSDSDLSVPSNGNGAYNSGGFITRTSSGYAGFLAPDQKSSYFSIPTREYPKVQIGEGYLNFSPSPDTIEIDYMRNIPVEIDVLDTVIDLEAYYSPKLLERLVGEAAVEFNLQARDLTQYGAQNNEVIENP